MIVEIVNTGSELMLGRVLNTHQQWLCRQLADAGYPVSRQVAVGDSGATIAEAVREALSRADLVITTGGLGPTSDDLTRECIAHMLNRALRLDPAVLLQIQDFFSRRGRPMPGRTRLEAMVPEGALVFPNSRGTAPGLAIEVKAGEFRESQCPGWLVLLPGPPRELQPMFQESALPLIKQVFASDRPFFCRTVRTIGIGESVLQERLEPGLQELVRKGLELGYCARPGQVDVRFVMEGPGAAEAVSQAERIVRAELGSSIYAKEDEPIEAVVVRLLKARNRTLSLAESCTGGCIAHRLTNIPGASAVFVGGFVAYSNAVKEKAIGVDSEILREHGAVSERVAREMAEGARTRTGSDFALGVTGIAGPDGGSVEKPVGTVFTALASAGATQVWKRLNAWDRLTFKEVTANQALNELRLLLEAPEL